MKKEKIIQISREWVQRMVIDLNLCPFAKHPFKNNKVRFSVAKANHMSEWIKAIFNEAHLLHSKPSEEISNTLLIFPNGLSDFHEFLDLVEMAQITIEDQNLNRVIQLASFHPKYQFAGTSIEDITNFTNRSPFPMLHLLRIDEVSEAIQHHQNTDQIPETNKSTLNDLGQEKLNIIYQKIEKQKSQADD